MNVFAMNICGFHIFKGQCKPISYSVNSTIIWILYDMQYNFGFFCNFRWYLKHLKMLFHKMVTVFFIPPPQLCHEPHTCFMRLNSGCMEREREWKGDKKRNGKLYIFRGIIIIAACYMVLQCHIMIETLFPMFLPMRGLKQTPVFMHTPNVLLWLLVA